MVTSSVHPPKPLNTHIATQTLLENLHPLIVEVYKYDARYGVVDNGRLWDVESWD
jgi:hypothetical protein